MGYFGGFGYICANLTKVKNQRFIFCLKNSFQQFRCYILYNEEIRQGGGTRFFVSSSWIFRFLDILPNKYFFPTHFPILLQIIFHDEIRRGGAGGVFS